MKERITFFLCCLMVMSCLLFNVRAVCAEELSVNPLLPADISDISTAAKIIEMVLLSTAAGSGEWWRAEGLLGTYCIPVEPNVSLRFSLGYFSLFHSAALNVSKTKMARSIETGKGDFILLEPNGSFSFIYQREYYFREIATLIYRRFTYLKNGEWGRNLRSSADHPSSKKLVTIIPKAHAFYALLKEKGFDDKTLGDLIGIALSVIKYDKKEHGCDMAILPQNGERYDAVLSQALAKGKKGMDMFEALEDEMMKQCLSYDDIIALPEAKKDQEKLIELIKKDFKLLEEEVKKAPVRTAKRGTGNKQSRKTVLEAHEIDPGKKQKTYKVKDVLNGNTLLVGNQARVRLRGVAIPVEARAANGDPSERAKGYLKKLCVGKNVFLEFDKGNFRDIYGNLCAYVFLEEGKFVNVEMLRNGYGSIDALYPFQYIHLFNEYAKDAKANKKGVWK